MPVDDVIKELVNSEIQHLRVDQGKCGERCDQVEKAIQELSGKFEERLHEVVQVRKEFDEHKITSNSLDARVGSVEKFEEAVGALRSRVERVENELSAVGLRQLQDRVDATTRDFADQQHRLVENCRIANAAKVRTDEFDLALRETRARCDRMENTVSQTDAITQEIGSSTRAVQEAQESLRESVSKKYERLWQDVLHAIEEFKDNQLQELRAELDRKTARDTGSTLVNHALQLMASATAERKQVGLCKQLVVAWKEQTWISARRRVGILLLHRIACRRQQSILSRWGRAAHFSYIAGQLRSEYNSMLPDVQQIISDSGLEEQCIGLENRLTSLMEMVDGKCSAISSDMECALRKQEEFFETRLVELQVAQEKLARADSVEKLTEQLTQDLTEQFTSQLRDQSTRHEQMFASVSEQIEASGVTLANSLESTAKSKEVQSIVSDVMVMWNSIKHLDASKVDRKDVDSMLLESSARERLAAQRFEDLETEIGGRVHEVATSSTERANELHGKFDETVKQAKQWEEMWDKMSAFVEDLVTKVTELQATAKQPTTCPRSGSMERWRPDNSVRPRLEAPPYLPISSSVFEKNSLSDVMSVKSVRSLDTEVGYPRRRPKSATIRRPHDVSR